MVTAGIAVGMLMLIKDKFGSTAVVAMPIVVGVGSAFIGLLLLPHVKMITTAIGTVINEFTTLQPILMSILICCSFATLIISPISTVAIGLAIQLNGVSAGAAAMGVAATAVALVVHSWKVNNSGVTLAIALGAMKLMMPNLFKYPVILIPCLSTAILSAIPVALFSVSGTPQSAGFGIVGLVGPLASIDAGLNVALAAIVWFVVPIAAAIASKILFENVLKLYDSSVVFKFQE
jgi:PTS system, IIC component